MVKGCRLCRRLGPAGQRPASGVSEKAAKNFHFTHLPLSFSFMLFPFKVLGELTEVRSITSRPPSL